MGKRHVEVVALAFIAPVLQDKLLASQVTGAQGLVAVWHVGLANFRTNHGKQHVCHVEAENTNQAQHSGLVLIARLDSIQHLPLAGRSGAKLGLHVAHATAGDAQEKTFKIKQARTGWFRSYARVA